MSIIGALFKKGLGVRQRSNRHIKALFNKELDSFAIKLVRDFAERYPPELESAPFPISPDRVTAALREASSMLAEFDQKQHLGASGKTDLQYLIRSELDKLGYSERFIERAAEALAI